MQESDPILAFKSYPVYHILKREDMNEVTIASRQGLSTVPLQICLQSELLSAQSLDIKIIEKNRILSAVGHLNGLVRIQNLAQI
jgi:hypothetical protein